MTEGSVVEGSHRLDATQRRLLLGVCTVVGAATVVPATYNYVLDPMLDGLGAGESQSSLLRQLPSIAALLVIFLAGVLGGRWGERRLIGAGSVLFAAGCAVVVVAPTLEVAVGGLVLESVGASALVVVALGLLSARVSEPEARASAFATFAVVGPCVYMFAPVLAGVLVDDLGWRWVPVLWTLAGLVMVAAARRLLPGGDSERAPGELVTPALAGLVLALGVQAINAVSSDGWTSSSFAIRAGATVLAVVALLWAYRRSRAPSLSVAALRRGGTLVLLVVVVIVPFANLWFYMTMGYQYVYGLDTLSTALVMIPAQLCGVGGGLVARKVLRRHGITRAGVGAILLLSAALAATWLIGVGSPIVVPVLVMCTYSSASVAAGIPLTNAVMDSAPPGESGSAAAFRGAAANVGSALGVVVMTAVVFGVVATSLTATLDSEGLAGQQSADIAASMRNGATSESVASDYSVPVQQVDEISAAQKGAMVDGLHAQGTVAALLTAGCAGIFLLGRRRQTRARPTVGSAAG